MTDREQKAAAKAFVKRWTGKGDEKQHTQLFWKELLQDVYGMSVNSDTVEFEKPVVYDGTTYIDVYIRSTRVMVEQKSLGISLDKQGIRHGEMLTPFEQAREYNLKLLADDKVKYIIVSNFETFRIHDLNKVNPHRNYTEISLFELPDRLHALDFMISEDKTPDDGGEDPISKQAGELVGALKDALKKQYKDPDSENAKRSLTILCVRLVFCLYAEDSDIFPKHLQFHDYLSKFTKVSANEVRSKLKELFRILDTPEDERDPYLDDDLNAFPYVNGGLFSDENIEIPRFTEEIIDILLRRASAGFDWSQINPTIFGAMFESVLSADERSGRGMHYTEPKNIHKVIDPLFLDGLKLKLEHIMSYKDSAHGAKVRELEKFRTELSQLTFLDPACGSGNFLTLAFCELRRLENTAIAEIQNITQNMQMAMVDTVDYTDIKVSIRQFYGIEIHDFAVAVARTALWIAEHQMIRETEEIIHQSICFLPLKSYPNIVHGNALRTNWENIVPKDKLNYIMGNPPFEGHQKRTDDQVDDMDIAFYDLEKHGKLDYVCAWYNKASDYMKNTDIQAAFVSTNSIIQGESVAILWKHLFEKKSVEIQFAYQSFIWNSEATDMAHVHCVIIGFTTYCTKTEKILYCTNTTEKIDHINGYLIHADDVFIQSRGKPLTKGMPEMSKGSQPTDGGNLILSKEEKEQLVSQYPITAEFIHRYISADDYINDKYRYCLWLKDVSPSKYRNIKPISKRLEQVSECRKKSPTISVKRASETPMLFTQIRQPNTDYLAMPEVSSGRRKYIPFGYVSSKVIASNMLYLIPNVNLYIFGVMTSNIHMAWLRIVGGRLKSDYRYTPAVYNNFPWCSCTPEQKEKIEQTAHTILDIREKYSDCSLADLYDDMTMPPDLRKAHKANDKAVIQAYGFKQDMTESEIVAELMKMYQKLTGGAAK